jgi:hypothetical protein
LRLLRTSANAARTPSLPFFLRTILGQHGPYECAHAPRPRLGKMGNVRHLCHCVSSWRARRRTRGGLSPRPTREEWIWCFPRQRRLISGSTFFSQARATVPGRPASRQRAWCRWRLPDVPIAGADTRGDDRQRRKGQGEDRPSSAHRRRSAPPSQEEGPRSGDVACSVRRTGPRKRAPLRTTWEDRG